MGGGGGDMRNYSLFSNRFGLQPRPPKQPHKYTYRVAREEVPNGNEQLGITESNRLFEGLEKMRRYK